MLLFFLEILMSKTMQCKFHNKPKNTSCSPSIKETSQRHKIFEMVISKKEFTQISTLDFVNGVNWLQVLQNTSSKEERYLTVATGKTAWGIRSTIDGESCFIFSGSAGGLCPADPTTGINKRLGQTSWQYVDAQKDEWVNGNIKLSCSTHFPQK